MYNYSIACETINGIKNSNQMNTNLIIRILQFYVLRIFYLFFNNLMRKP